MPRNTKPDGENQSVMILIKRSYVLRLTQQIRLLTYLAAKNNKTLILEVRKECILDIQLEQFLAEFSMHLQLERV